MGISLLYVVNLAQQIIHPKSCNNFLYNLRAIYKLLYYSQIIVSVILSYVFEVLIGRQEYIQLILLVLIFVQPKDPYLTKRNCKKKPITLTLPYNFC